MYYKKYYTPEDQVFLCYNLLVVFVVHIGTINKVIFFIIYLIICKLYTCCIQYKSIKL